MRRLFRIKNLIALILVLGILWIILYVISTGWVNLVTHLSQAIAFAALVYVLRWNMIYRQEHDPVRRFCFRIWDAFWNKFS